MTVEIKTGDCRDVMARMADESVHCVVTSPPYWGLRDYKVPPTIWGGDLACDHEWGEEVSRVERRRADKGLANTGWGAAEKRLPGLAAAGFISASQGHFCRCGAWHGALGLEPTFQMYVDHMVEVFREVRRVLREDGTLWLNLGDSYATAGGYGGDQTPSNVDSKQRSNEGSRRKGRKNQAIGLKHKDLCGIPWRVAFALQADGWWLRSDIIWSKPNPMPESVTDRPTKAHEYLFLLSKSERYYYDAEAIKEGASYDPESTKFPDGWDTGPGGHGAFHRNGREKGRASGNRTLTEYARRNKRSVWEIATSPFPEAHFATFPPALVEPCIKAGCPGDGVVLDPFGGSGTTGLVADRLQRNAFLIDLSEDYAMLASNRIKAAHPLFAEVFCTGVAHLVTAAGGWGHEV